MRFLFLVLLVMSSCAPVYRANLRQSPLFTKAGEFQGSFNIDGGINAQASVAVSKHIGLMSNFSYSDINRSEADGEGEYNKHQFWEGGVGYYQNRKRWCWEVFSGYGMGEGSSNDEFSVLDAQSMYAAGKYRRFFIQPAMGLNKKIFQVSFIMRFSFVNFYSFENDKTGTTIAINSSPDFFYEPAIMGRVNLLDSRLFASMQIGSCMTASKDVYYDYTPAIFGFGLGFRLGGMRALDIVKE